MGCPKAIHAIPPSSAQLLCPNSVPGVPKTCYAHWPQPFGCFQLCSATTSGGTGNGRATSQPHQGYRAHTETLSHLCQQEGEVLCVCVCQPGAPSPNPELLHRAKGKVDNLGVVGSLRIQQHSCIQTRWGSDKGILALLSSQCLKLPCIVCPMLRASPQH